MKLTQFIPQSLFSYLKRIKSYREIFNRSALDFESNIHIVSASDTMSEILRRLKRREKFAFLRFGDGDIYILNGGKDREQLNSRKLMKEQQESFMLNDDNIIKGLAIHSKKFGCDKLMSDGVHLQSDQRATDLLKGSFEYFVGQKIWSPVPLHYCMVYQKEVAIDFFAEISMCDSIFVGGEHNNSNILEQLLSTKNFIWTPEKNAYEKIETIYAEIKNLLERKNSFTVILFSCGMTARSLIRRLHKLDERLYLFDLGSVVDLFRTQSRWTWVSKSGWVEATRHDFLKKVAARRLHLLDANRLTHAGSGCSKS